jgi:hypothetical protein
VTAFIDDADGAQIVGGQAREKASDALVEQVACREVVPAVLREEQLHGADAGAGGQSDGLGSLPLQVGEQAATVGAEVGEGLRVLAAEQEVVKVVGQRGPKVENLLLGHGQASEGYC